MSHAKLIFTRRRSRWQMPMAMFVLLIGATISTPLRAQDAPMTLAEFAESSPAVAAALEMDRSTPAGKMRAVVTLLDLGEPTAAGLVLQELTGAELSNEVRADLVREFGAARFLELIRLDRPGATGNFTGARTFAQACLDAAAEWASDPERISRLIDDLKSKDPEQRNAAMVDLRGSGDAAIKGLFAALAGAGDDDELRSEILLTLAEMRPGIDQPLVAGLADGEGQFRQDLAELALRKNVSAAALWLAALSAAESPTPAGQAVRQAIADRGIALSTPTDVADAVSKRLAGLRNGVPGLSLDAEDMATWWSWDPATEQLASTRVALPNLQVLAGARLLRAAEAADALTPELAAQAVSYRLQRASLRGEIPSDELLASIDSYSTDELNALLAEAVTLDHGDAASQFAAALGRRGDVAAVITTDGRPSPLVAAVTSPNRKLRFAALEAVMAINPRQSFPGASHVREALWEFAAGGGPPVAVVASSQVGVATNWAGLLRVAGFDAMPAESGLDAIRLAIDPAISGRLALIALDSDLGSPGVGELLYQLRTHSTLRHVPVAVLCSVYRLPDAQRWADADPALVAVIRPRDAAAMQTVADKAAALPFDPLPDRDDRQAQAVQAMTWIGQLLAAGGPYDELARDANIAGALLLTTDLTDSSLAVLQQVGTHDAQAALVEAASNLALPLETRQAAAEAFAANVAAHGMRLTRSEELQQFDRYNASESADAETQQVLERLLDVIEGE